MRARFGSRAAAIVAALVLLLLAAGCAMPGPADGASPGQGGAWSGCGPASAVTGVSITRPHSALGPPGGIAALSASSRDATASRRLYRAACRLVEVEAHPKAVSCPADFGVVYKIRFRSARSSPATATYAATGCGSLAMRTAAGSRSTMVIGSRAAALEPAFRSALAGILHLSVDNLA
ncbi:MAG TPA: hypothetical protein VIA06_24370 [Candidatus Dormibacteraeota bacterium]|nr:hypothetical protein [Candidatus Dormibacteraeota bacterium]